MKIKVKDRLVQIINLSPRKIEGEVSDKGYQVNGRDIVEVGNDYHIIEDFNNIIDTMPIVKWSFAATQPVGQVPEQKVQWRLIGGKKPFVRNSSNDPL